jgi:hypothetical protein
MHKQDSTWIAKHFPSLARDSEAAAAAASFLIINQVAGERSFQFSAREPLLLPQIGLLPRVSLSSLARALLVNLSLASRTSALCSRKQSEEAHCGDWGKTATGFFLHFSQWFISFCLLPPRHRENSWRCLLPIFHSFDFLACTNVCTCVYCFVSSHEA